MGNQKLFFGGVALMLIIGSLFLWMRPWKKAGGEIATAAQTSVEEQTQTYEVKAGDSLWVIAMATYNDGNKWTNIYENNKSQIINPNYLEIGMKLTLPKLAQEEMKTYTVQKGDNLWNIAQTQCNSGYMWTSIARQNNLAHPKIIHRGNVLKFLCLD